MGRRQPVSFQAARWPASGSQVLSGPRLRVRDVEAGPWAGYREITGAATRLGQGEHPVEGGAGVVGRLLVHRDLVHDLARGQRLQ